jgi:hypothetical protein
MLPLLGPGKNVDLSMGRFCVERVENNPIMESLSELLLIVRPTFKQTTLRYQLFAPVSL